MAFNLRFHIGDATQTQCKVAYSTLSDTDVTLTVEGIGAGNVADSGRTDQHGATFIGTGFFTVTGLTAFTKYTFTISQGDESYTGSFRTMPADQETKFSILMQTCTFWKENGSLAFKDMRNVVNAYESIAPVTYLFDIDDVMYVDFMEVAGATVIPNSSGQAQLTGLASDYAVAWAAWHGHEPTYDNMINPDFQWMLRNVASGKTGGDHAIEGNHCRGQTGNSDYIGCDRTLEATAMGVWDGFIGDANPDMLGVSGYYWGKEIGPIRFAAIDEFSFSDPQDGTNHSESRTTHPMLGDQQITDIQTYLDVDIVPFKTMCMSTGFSIAGQPWAEWWRDESTYFHGSVLNSDNLNGTDGWFFGMVGDNHTLHVQQMNGGTGTGFWSFCPGTTGASSSAQMNGTKTFSFGTKTGKTAYYRGSDGDAAIADRPFGAFLHVIVHADETPKRIEVRGIETGGNEVFIYNLKAESGNDNQFDNPRKMNIAI